LAARKKEEGKTDDWGRKKTGGDKFRGYKSSPDKKGAERGEIEDVQLKGLRGGAGKNTCGKGGEGVRGERGGVKAINGHTKVKRKMGGRESEGGNPQDRPKNSREALILGEKKPMINGRNQKSGKEPWSGQVREAG